MENTKIASGQAENILLNQFGILGKAYALPGEIDFNFKIKTKDKLNYILKISRPNANFNQIELQQDLLSYLNDKGTMAPKVIPNKTGKKLSTYIDDFGNKRCVRLLTWIPGRLWSQVNPQLDDLRFSLGEHCGLLTKALHGFDHREAHRDFEWDVAQSLWTKAHLGLFKEVEKSIIAKFQEDFESTLPTYNTLRKSIVHNDANDNNIIVSRDLINPKVKAIIDYGDAQYTQIINDVAITCAYAIMHHNEPLDAALPIIKGYHQAFPLQEEELVYLYHCIAMRLVTSVTKSAINKIKEPNNSYLSISEKPAWVLLKKWASLSPDFAHYSFRVACGYPAHPDTEKFNLWASKFNLNISEIFPTVQRHEFHPIDLSVSSKWLGHEKEFNNLALFQFKIDQLQKQVPDKVIAGGYLEPRSLYTSTAYDKMGNNGPENRTIHLGVDFWLPAYTPIHAFIDGEVVTAVNDIGEKEYGGLIILKHQVEDLEFFTLYGHNTVASVLKHQAGDVIKRGDKIAELGNYPENGNWASHLHFQMMMSMLNFKIDFPGVTYFSQMDVWKGLCPDPNLLFKSEALTLVSKNSNNDLISFRQDHIGKGLSLQYNTPIKMVRGAGQYLIDQYGRKYLDTVNNVAHVGHEHYEVVKAGQDQMALINTNSRYLHDNINVLAKELLDTLPAELSVIHFVNSGSEANELAIRMVKTATGSQDIIASEMGYHGNTNTCIDISSYKFDGRGGNGTPKHTHIFPIPDSFRGIYTGDNTGNLYAEEVKKCIKDIQAKNRDVGALIIEPIISCGGQIELPKGFLKMAYMYVRDAGGLCISDEVQTGCGRLGKAFWGFQLHDVIPDIVTIGKPLGNGHPVAAVACTRDLADKFANGMEYFNTFGGNPVSCAIATEVLMVVKREKLQENALHIGGFLKTELEKLALNFPIIGDVRGQGFFLGIELVDSKMKPLSKQANYLVNRMKEFGVLMSLDGPDHNVIKIKPPMVFSKQNADKLILYLDKILREDFMTSL